MRLRFASSGPACTEALGAAVAGLLVPGDTVLLRGEVGAGKTTFVRGAARALGVADPVTSPTFTLAHAYRGRVPVAHLDAYRIASPDDEELGLVREAIGEGSVAFVEWPETLGGGALDARIAIDLAHGGGDSRLVLLWTPDAALWAGLRRRLDDLRARHRHPQSKPGPGGRP